MITEFGRTRIIANPRAQSGQGEVAAQRLQRFLSLYLHDADAFDLVFTEKPRHATELAAASTDVDTVCALGGDGVIHEVVCGLMRIPAAQRPALALLPIGSGNDFARTLGIEDWHGSDLAALLSCKKTRIDLIRIEHESGLEFAVETFAIGLDAAIGLGANEVRKGSKLAGAPLYFASAANAFGKNYRTYPMTVTFDDEEPRRLQSIVMAVQNGPTYGSGFRICPSADPADGLLDVCYACGPFPRAKALGIFLAAKQGLHTRFKRIEMRRVKHVAFDLEAANYPIEADGERVCAQHLEVSVMPSELAVFRPRSAKRIRRS